MNSTPSSKIQQLASYRGLRRKVAINATDFTNFLLTHRFKGAGILVKLGKSLARQMAPTPKGATICSTRHGFDIIVDPIIGKVLERIVYFYGGYEEGTINIMKKNLRNGDIFVDVGANIGLMSLAASRFVGKEGAVFSFEPEPEIFAILQSNINLNKAANINAYNAALGSTKGKATIYTNLDVSRGAASLIKPPQKNCEGKEVLVETLDEFALNNNLTNIRMLKIDVEGWELEVLKGAKTQLGGPEAPILCVECTTLHAQYGGNPEDIYKFIKSVNDYSCYKLKYSKEVPSELVKISDEKELPRHDNIFCFLDKHLRS